jgi:hypothetical protein
MTYIAPRYSLTAKRTAEIPFMATVGAAAQLTILSDLISFPFVVRSILIDFGSDHVDRVLHYVLLSTNRTTSITVVPADTNAFTGLSTIGYAIGDNREKRFYPNVEWRQTRSYMKVHVINNNAYAVNVKVNVTIEELV